MSQLKNNNTRKAALLLSLILIGFACYSSRHNDTVISQVVENQNNILKQNEESRLIGKAYIRNSDKEKIIEFKSAFNDDGNETLSVYSNGLKKVSLNNVANPRVLSDFYDSWYDRVFVLAVAAPASGICGNSSFSIVTVDEETDEIKISRPSKIECQGEIQDIKIETKNEKKPYRQITIDRLNFNLESFEWIETNKNKK